METESEIERGPSSAIERAQALSRALSEAARHARISKRSRRYLSAGGFQARSDAKIWRIFLVLSFLLIVAIPTGLSAVYFLFIASDQYLAEAKFTVSGGEPVAPDAIGSITGVPLLAIVQDTQIVTNYIQSRAALEKLQTNIDIRRLYSGPDIDFVARFDSHKPIEKFVRYWKHMSSASITMPAGIVELKVWAFTPQDASRIANAVLQISEALINDMNDRMHHDAVSEAEQEVDSTFARLVKAQVALQSARDASGLLDAVKAADEFNKLITSARAQLLEFQAQYDSELKYVSSSAPQMRALKSRIDATAGQIAELESKLTLTKSAVAGATTLAASMTKFSELQLENDVAQKLYSGALATLEIARLSAENKMMYINTFVRPVVPEEPDYPRRPLLCAAVLAASLAIWGLCCGVAALIRNYGA
jgi:capsular polysaccharide transport system permease protein